MWLVCYILLPCVNSSFPDKTQGFTRQIEAKQRELQPWSAKIRQKGGEINIAKNERDSLQRKVEAARNAGAEAKAALEALKAEHQAKVGSHHIFHFICLLIRFLIGSQSPAGPAREDRRC